MTSSSTELKDKFGFGVPSASSSWQPLSHSSATSALNVARHHYSNEVHKAANASLRNIISGLIDARRNHDLDDDAFAEVMEIVLAHYIENQVSSTVETVLSSRFVPIFKFGLGNKR